jgi:hypothetical protein
MGVLLVDADDVRRQQLGTVLSFMGIPWQEVVESDLDVAIETAGPLQGILAGELRERALSELLAAHPRLPFLSLMPASHGCSNFIGVAEAPFTYESLTDPDSGNFNGGRLDLYYVQGGSAEDQLGVIHDDAPGQIGVAGSTISYGGAVIGTMSGGADGSNLRIDFTSTAATVEAVEALIQRLGYRNADSSPTASRTLALRIADIGEHRQPQAAMAAERQA